MDTLALVLGTLTGLRFAAPGLAGPTTVLTSICMLITYAVIARVFASGAGRSRNGWTLAGLLGGAPAILALLVLGELDGRRQP